MNVVLTMAGKYSRFRLFGNKVPKYLLPLGAETMLAEVIKQIYKSLKNCNLFLIANRDDQVFLPIVRSIMRNYNINYNSLIYIDDTSSQLETALFASELIASQDLNSPITFVNIDTILRNRSKFYNDLEMCAIDEAMLDVFVAANKQYSYARISADNLVTKVVDKNIINNNACSGLYGFGSYYEMSKTSAELLKKNGLANFTDLYNEYISLGRKVFAHKTVDPSNTIVLGTPEEYLINIHRFK